MVNFGDNIRTVIRELSRGKRCSCKCCCGVFLGQKGYGLNAFIWGVEVCMWKVGLDVSFTYKQLGVDI